MIRLTLTLQSPPDANGTSLEEQHHWIDFEPNELADQDAFGRTVGIRSDDGHIAYATIGHIPSDIRRIGLGRDPGVAGGAGS